VLRLLSALLATNRGNGSITDTAAETECGTCTVAGQLSGAEVLEGLVYLLLIELTN
jgi:hypothetical protein